MIYISLLAILFLIGPATTLTKDITILLLKEDIADMFFITSGG
jgi:hypothetical protein